MLRPRPLTLAAIAVAVAALSLLPIARSAAGPPIEIAVFEFELNDASASDGVVARDTVDIKSLKEATATARRMLSVSGRYSVVDTGGVRAELKGDIRHCRGCEAALAGKVGADQSLAGVVTRVGRVEYTMQIVVRDARTGRIVSNHFTGLRMGANYAWPRAVKWLMDNRILAAGDAQ